jgi:hypothetical protein
MARPLQKEVRTPISASEIAGIGINLYRGVEYNGRPSWQSWLADGLAVDAATVRRWLMTEMPSRRAIPQPIAVFLVAADKVADRLQLWNQPRGTLIAERMAQAVFQEK